MMNGRLRLINLYVSLQGSLGFPGVAGVPGEKGRRVRTVHTFNPYHILTSSEYLNFATVCIVGYVKQATDT